MSEEIASGEALERWLESLPDDRSRKAAVAVAVRSALRVLPMFVRSAPHLDVEAFENFIFILLFACASARVAAKYPGHASDLLGDITPQEGISNAVQRAFSAGKSWPNGNIQDFVYHSANAACDACHAAYPIAFPGGASITATVARYARNAADRAANAAGVAASSGVRRVLNAWRHIEYGAEESARLDIWKSVSRDVSALVRGVGGEELVSQPLWHDGAPKWASEDWQLMQSKLSKARGSLLTFASRHDQDEGWRVWIDWYERRLEGVSESEETELVFAAVPESVRQSAPRAANAWIGARVPKRPR